MANILLEAAHRGDLKRFDAILVCQSKSRYDDQAVADSAATKIQRYGRGEGHENMHSYRCSIEDDGVHFHLTRRRRRR